MEALLPGRIAQNRDLLAVLGFLGGKDSAQQRRHSERGENSGSQARGAHLGGLTGAGKFKARELIASKSCKGVGISRVRANIRHGDPGLAIAPTSAP